MNQKEEEKLILQYFRKNCPDFPKGRLIPSESPDFILRISPKKSIGIELTGLSRDADLLSGIIQAVEKKEGKRRSYQTMHLAELWLIIHADDAFSGMKFNIRNQLGSLPVSTAFSKVFFFDLFSGKIFPVVQIPEMRI